MAFSESAENHDLFVLSNADRKPSRRDDLSKSYKRAAIVIAELGVCDSFNAPPLRFQSCYFNGMSVLNKPNFSAWSSSFKWKDMYILLTGCSITSSWTPQKLQLSEKQRTRDQCCENLAVDQLTLFPLQETVYGSHLYFLTSCFFSFRD